MNYISDGRVAEWDSIVSHLHEMTHRPKDETRKELMEDYMRKMNVLVVDNHRKGTKGTEQERLGSARGPLGADEACAAAGTRRVAAASLRRRLIKARRQNSWS